MQEVAITSSNMQETHIENMSQIFPEKCKLREIYIELYELTIADVYGEILLYVPFPFQKPLLGGL